MLDFLFYLTGGLLGAWLVNYLSDVLPHYRKLHYLTCPSCAKRSSWKRYLVYTGCESCGEKTSPRHLVIMIGLPILSILAGSFPITSMGSTLTLIWLAYFSLVVVIDLEHRLILHPISLAGAGLGLLTGSSAHGLWNTLIGGGAGFTIMLMFYFLGEAFVRLLSRRRGEQIEEVALGFGDVNLAGISGLLLGWPGVIGGIFLAVILGGVISGFYLLIQKIRGNYQAFQALPYGPFLVVSLLALLFMASYLQL